MGGPKNVCTTISQLFTRRCAAFVQWLSGHDGLRFVAAFRAFGGADGGWAGARLNGLRARSRAGLDSGNASVVGGCIFCSFGFSRRVGESVSACIR
jgi:hypothetical protein